MIDFVEELLLAWGAEQINPSIEVSIPSPLGQVDEGGAGIGGHRCLSLSEQYAAADRRVVAVEQALRDIVSELGLLGRQLDNLADVRYARRPALPLAGQHQLLQVSRNTYRARLDRLHVEIAARYPDLEGVIARLEAATPAALARQSWVEKVRKAAARAEKQRSKRAANAPVAWQLAVIELHDGHSSGCLEYSRCAGGVVGVRSVSGDNLRFTPLGLG